MPLECPTWPYPSPSLLDFIHVPWSMLVSNSRCELGIWDMVRANEEENKDLLGRQFPQGMLLPEHCKQKQASLWTKEVRLLPSARWPRDIWGLGTLRSIQCHPNCPSISHVTTCSPQMPQFILTLGKYCDSLKATMGDLVLLMVIRTKSLKSWAYYFFKMKPLQCSGKKSVYTLSPRGVITAT